MGQVDPQKAFTFQIFISSLLNKQVLILAWFPKWILYIPLTDLLFIPVVLFLVSKCLQNKYFS